MLCYNFVGFENKTSHTSDDTRRNAYGHPPSIVCLYFSTPIMHELFVRHLSPPRAPLSASEKEKQLASPPHAPPSASEKKRTAPALLPCTSVSAFACASASTSG